MVVLEHAPRPTLSRIIDHLGSTLLEVVAGEVTPETVVGGVAIHDTSDPPQLPDRAIVLAVGTSDAAQLAELVRTAGTQSAACVMARLPVEVTPELLEVVAETKVVVLGLTRGASWTHVVTLLRSLLGGDDIDLSNDELATSSHGDLFTLATAISSLLDAPVTIEDLDSAVLAFSPNQELADESRKEGILGRRVPERYTRELAERGFFRRVYSSAHPVHLEAFHGGDLNRVAVRICAGGEVLGSMWAAVREPLDQDRLRAFGESAKIVALQMLRQRAGADVERRLRTDLVATLFEGGPRSREAAESLGLAGGPACVLALGMQDDGDPLGHETELQRASAAFALHLSALQPRSAVALLGGVVYGVLRTSGPADNAEQRALGVATKFLDRLSSRDRMLIGVGRLAADPTEIPRARSDAMRALRVLRSGQVDEQTTRSSQIEMQSILLDVCDMAVDRRWETSRPLAKLINYDAGRSSSLLDTLRAWLEHFGDVNAACDALEVHHNTFRYRLRRVVEVSGLDLDDPESRFTTMLELRMLRIMRATRGASRPDTDEPG